MEAPEPITIMTPEDDNISLTQKKEFKISHEKTEYLTEIGKSSFSEKLIIKLKEISSSANAYYSNSFNLESLQSIHKSFRYFDNINEAISSIQDIFEEKNVSIKLDINNIVLMLKIPKIGKGEDLIPLELKKNSMSLKDICENLSKEVSDLKNRINELEKENQNFKNDISMLQNEISLLKEENKKRDLRIEEIEKWKNKIENKEIEENNRKKIDSKILTEKEDIVFISNRLKKLEYFKGKDIFYELIFRGTRDGRTSDIFHKICDGKAKTITIIKTIKGLKFGGYIEREWKSYGYWVKDDENCFVFSLDLKKIYEPVKGKDKYYFNQSYGPDFAVFGLENNLFEKSSLNLKKKEDANNYFKLFNTDYEINGGENVFQVAELEVFRIYV